MTEEERTALIDQLDRSFQQMSVMDKTMVKHAMGAPTHHPETGKEFESFREVIECSTDDTLTTLKDDFEFNELLLPATTH